MQGLIKTRLWVGGAFFACVALVIVAGELVFHAQETWPTTYDTKPVLPDPSAFMNGVDKPVAMVFSLSLGLFVLVGFVLKEMRRGERARLYVVAVCALFLLSSIFSIYMGFLAREVALYYLSFPLEKSITLAGRFVSYQLIGSAVSGLFAILLLGDHYLSAPPSGGRKGDSEEL